MSGRFAENTSVPAERSRAEVERTLQRYGASSFGYGWNDEGAIVTFEAHNRRIQFTLIMPRRDDEDFTRTPTGKARSTTQAQAAWEQATRQRWRALALVVKAKLEAVAAGISSFEEEFLAHTLVPGPKGRPVTVAELMLPQVDEAYQRGAIPSGMLALPEKASR